MRFDFDDEQLALQQIVRQYCADRLDLTRVAEREGVPADAYGWRGLADLGALGILRAGATGLGPVEAALVLEELGRHLASGPLVWSVIAAPLLDGVAEGDIRVTGIEMGVQEDGPVVVEHATEADAVLVLHDDRVETIDRHDLGAGDAGAPIDPLTPTRHFDRIPTGRPLGGPDDAAQLRRAGTVLSSAALVGVAQGALDVAREYALERHQFDVPIGSFQAVKHLLADMYVRVELARAETYAAAALLAAASTDDADRAIGAAKLLAGEAGLANARAAVQILGGMGFTWDMLPHYYLKRAWVLEHGFGTSSHHAHQLGASVGAEVRADA